MQYPALFRLSLCDLMPVYPYQSSSISPQQFRLIPQQMMSNPSPRGDYRRGAAMDKQQPSRVLLVCIYDTIALEVNNQLVYERFSKFGSIVKVLIFEKGEVTKLFVEFTDKAFAQQAKGALDGTKLLGAICKMNIYYSNFANVDLKNETSEGADFTLQEEMRLDYMRRFDTLTRSFQGEQHDMLNDDYMGAAFTPFVPRSKTDNPRRLQEEFNRVNAMQTLYPPASMINEEEEIEHMIHHGINNLLDNHSASSAPKSYPNTSTHSSERISPALKIKQVSQARSSVLSFELQRELSIRCVYNLFSNFGNISFISKKAAKRVYIKFRTIQFAAIAYTYLNEYFLMGNLLKLDSPADPEEASPKEAEYCECVFYDQSYDRFTPHRSLTVNSPSQTLHVSSLKKQVCRQGTLYKIFSEWGKVEAVKILCYSNEKNMALVKFYSVEDSFEAIAHLHNEVFSGRKMQISFTKSKV